MGLSGTREREWKRLHSEELHDLYSSPYIFSGNKIEKNELGGTCSTFWGEGRGAYRALVGKHEGKRPLGTPRRSRREDNIKMDLLEVGWRGLDWIALA